MDKYAKQYVAHTTSKIDIEPKARAGRVLNPDGLHFLDEYIPNEAVCDVVIDCFEQYFIDGSIENDSNVAEGILSQYFRFISVDEAKELVLKKYRDRSM